RKHFFVVFVGHLFRSRNSRAYFSKDPEAYSSQFSSASLQCREAHPISQQFQIESAHRSTPEPKAAFVLREVGPGPTLPAVAVPIEMHRWRHLNFPREFHASRLPLHVHARPGFAIDRFHGFEQASPAM